MLRFPATTKKISYAKEGTTDVYFMQSRALTISLVLISQLFS